MTTEREVSVPFSLPTPVPDRRVTHAESGTLPRQLAVLLDRRADDVASHWSDQVGEWLPDGAMAPAEDAPASTRAARIGWAAALVRTLAAALANGEMTDDAAAMGRALGASAFTAGVMLHQLLRGLDLLLAMCLHVVEDGAGSDEARHVEPAEAVRACRRLQAGAADVTIAAARGYADGVDSALRERFRRLRHDLRNPLGTIRSALSLMADETVPEEARRSPRFRTMIERNTAALDQMIVARLSDAEARLVPASGRGGDTSSAPLTVTEPRDDLARPRQRDDRQTGSL